MLQCVAVCCKVMTSSYTKRLIRQTHQWVLVTFLMSHVTHKANESKHNREIEKEGGGRDRNRTNERACAKDTERVRNRTSSGVSSRVSKWILQAREVKNVRA